MPGVEGALAAARAGTDVAAALGPVLAGGNVTNVTLADAWVVQVNPHYQTLDPSTIHP